MSRSTLPIPSEFLEAPPEERIAFVQMLWDEIAQDPESVPITDHHKAILDERLQAYAKNQEAGEPWDVVRDRILADLRSR
jgi:putative addiction module component (TIGR02574 family)